MSVWAGASADLEVRVLGRAVQQRLTVELSPVWDSCRSRLQGPASGGPPSDLRWTGRALMSGTRQLEAQPIKRSPVISSRHPTPIHRVRRSKCRHGEGKDVRRRQRTPRSGRRRTKHPGQSTELRVGALQALGSGMGPHAKVGPPELSLRSDNVRAGCGRRNPPGRA